MRCCDSAAEDLKTLRRDLFAAAVAAGGVDARDAGQVAALGALLKELLEELRCHGAVELHPLLASEYPGWHRRLQRAHAELEPLLAGLEREARLFAGAPSPLGSESLYRGALGLIAAYLPHFEEEETLLKVMPTTASRRVA